MIGELVGLPTEPDAEVHSLAGQIIQVDNTFRKCDWVMLDGQRHHHEQS